MLAGAASPRKSGGIVRALANSRLQVDPVDAALAAEAVHVELGFGNHPDRCGGAGIVRGAGHDQKPSSSSWVRQPLTVKAVRPGGAKEAVPASIFAAAASIASLSAP